MKKLLIGTFLIILCFTCLSANKFYLPKDNQELPDNYGAKVVYINGKIEELELASHFLNKEIGLLEVWTKEDICQWIPITNIQKIVFDKRFSQMIAIKEKNKK